MARLETRLENIPTKQDLESIKTLIAEKESLNTRWMIGIISAAMITMLAALIRTFVG